MFPTIASAFATLFYCLSAFLIYKQLGTAQHQRWIALAPAVVAVLLQALALNQQIIRPEGLNLGLFPAFALIAWLISIQVLLSSIYRRIESLGIIVFPITGLAGLAAGLDFSVHLISTGSSMIQSHIMISIIAYSLITLGVLQAGGDAGKAADRKDDDTEAFDAAVNTGEQDLDRDQPRDQRKGGEKSEVESLRLDDLLVQGGRLQQHAGDGGGQCRPALMLRGTQLLVDQYCRQAIAKGGDRAGDGGEHGFRSVAQEPECN